MAGVALAEVVRCVLLHVHRWHVVLPTSPIAPGEELCINYSAEPLSNVDTLLAWGFTGRPRPLDPVLPMAYRALPALDAHLVASTAMQMLTERSAGLDRSTCADLEAQLLAVAGGLPLGGPSANAAGSVTGTGAGADGVLLDDQYSEAAALFSCGGVMSLSPWLSGSSWQHTHGAAQQRGMRAGSSSKQKWAGAGAAAEAKLAMEEVGGMAAYVGKSSAQQQAKVADIRVAFKHAGDIEKQQDNRTYTPGVQPGAAGRRLQSQLQLLTVQACSAAARLQLLHAYMTAAEATQLRQVLSECRAPAEPQLSQRCVSQNLHLPSTVTPRSHLQQRKSSTKLNGVLQPADTSTAAPAAQPKAEFSASAVGQFTQAQELQHTTVTVLLMLQASLVLDAVSGSTHSRVCPAAERLFISVKPQAEPDVMSFMGSLQHHPREQELHMQQLSHLQDVQLQHLQMCDELTEGSGVPEELSVTDNCRVAVADQVNKLQENLLRVCVTLLERLADALRAGA